MNSDRLWRGLTLLIAVVAVVGTAAAAAIPGSATAPLPMEGSPPPAAIAHRDDMTARVPPTGSPRSPAAADPVPNGEINAGVPRRPPARHRLPVALEIPELGVESGVIPTSMDGNRSVLVPEDVLVTGWYDGSRRLGARQGSTVLVGHRDSATQGSGALSTIDQAPVGARITVVGADGTRYPYVVDSVELIDKANLPVEAPRVFTRFGPHRLVLITCGGTFDPSVGSYESNVVVTAVPTASSPHPSMQSTPR